MKKKMLALALVLLAIPIMSAIPVQAGKGQNRLSILFEVGSYDGGTFDKLWNCPKKVLLPEYTRVMQIRGGDWGDPATHAGFLIVVDEGGLDIEFDDDEIAYSNSYDAKFRNAFYGQEALPYVIMNIRVRETWVIDTAEYEGYIEILTVDTVYDYANLYEGIHGEGSFVGNGEINGQKIKVSGVSLLDGSALPTREGIVMGWPTP